MVTVKKAPLDQIGLQGQGRLGLMQLVEQRENPAAMLGRLGGKSRSKRKQEAA